MGVLHDKAWVDKLKGECYELDLEKVYPTPV